MIPVITISDKQTWNNTITKNEWLILEVIQGTLRFPTEVYGQVTANPIEDAIYVIVDVDSLDVTTIIPDLPGPPEIPTFFILQDTEVKHTLTGDRAEPETAIQVLVDGY